MNREQFITRPWTVDYWTISGIHTGYRVIRHLSAAAGDYEVAKGFAGDIYKPGSFADAKAAAEALCDKLNAELGLETA